MYQDPSNLPELKNPLPMPEVKPPKTRKYEQTRRALYDALAKVRKAKKHPKATDALETALEEHLEELRASTAKDTARIGELYSSEEQWKRIAIERRDALREMTKERDDCQERMRVIDEAYRKSQEALKIAGDELRAAQEINAVQVNDIRALREQVEALETRIEKDAKNYRTDREDLMAAEKLCDDQDDKLRAGERVIADQERLIAGQRKAIADMHNELTHRRVIGKAFMQARQAFVALDEALHEAPQSKAIRAVGDDVECAGKPAGEGV